MALVAGARILAHVVNAGSVVRTLVVGGAFATLALVQGIANVTSQAGADWPLLTEIVVTRRALGVDAAGIWVAEILCITL